MLPPEAGATSRAVLERRPRRFARASWSSHGCATPTAWSTAALTSSASTACLALEVEVEARAGDLRRLEDVGDAELVEASLGEESLGGVEDGLAEFALLALGAVLPSRHLVLRG